MARPKRAVTTAKAAVAKTAEPKTTEVKATEVKEVKAEEKKVVEEKAAAKTTAKKTTRKPACKVSTCVELNGLSVSVAEVEAAVKKAQGHQPVGTKQRRRQAACGAVRKDSAFQLGVALGEELLVFNDGTGVGAGADGTLFVPGLDGEVHHLAVFLQIGGHVGQFGELF